MFSSKHLNEVVIILFAFHSCVLEFNFDQCYSLRVIGQILYIKESVVV